MSKIMGKHSGGTVGEVHSYSGSSIPNFALACDGSTVLQASFPKLFAILGTTWNIGGEPVGSFRLPDLRGRTILGDGAGYALTPRTLGQTLGFETHVVGAAHIPAHTHNWGAQTGGQNADHTHNDHGHSHTINNAADGVFVHVPGAAHGWGGGIDNKQTYLGNGTELGYSSLTGVTSDHSHYVSGTTDNGPGSSTAIDHMNPMTVAKYYIVWK